MKHLPILPFILFWLASVAAVPSFSQTPYCDLFRYGKHKERQTSTFAILVVPLEVPSVDGNEKYVFSPSCNNRDFFALADFGNTRVTLPTPAGVSATPPSARRFFEVQLRGRLSVRALPSYGHLDAFRAKFVISEILSAKEIINPQTRPNFTANAPIIDAAVSLKSTNLELLFALFRNDGSLPLATSNCSEKTRWVLNGRNISPLELSRMFKKDALEKMSIATTDLSNDRSLWRVRGLVGLEQPMRRIQFNNSFALEKEGEWKCVEMSFKSEF